MSDTPIILTRDLPPLKSRWQMTRELLHTQPFGDLGVLFAVLVVQSAVLLTAWFMLGGWPKLLMLIGALAFAVFHTYDARPDSYAWYLMWPVHKVLTGIFAIAFLPLAPFFAREDTLLESVMRKEPKLTNELQRKKTTVPNLQAAKMDDLAARIYWTYRERKHERSSIVNLPESKDRTEALAALDRDIEHLASEIKNMEKGNLPSKSYEADYSALSYVLAREQVNNAEGVF